jgi:hypothetical protein
MPERLWDPGEAVVLRHSRADQVYRWAAALRMVEDRGDFVALYLQPGNEIRRMVGHDGEPTRDFYHATRVVSARWGLNHALHLTHFGDAYSVHLFWDEATWEFRCWYINFQEPLRRSRLGFETMDQTLDLVISPDLSRWQWKDEDEFEQGIAYGWYTREQHVVIQALGERVLEQVARREGVFGEPWPSWRPERAWTPLALPGDWDG